MAAKFGIHSTTQQSAEISIRRDPLYQVNSYPEHVGEGVDLGSEGWGYGERGAVQYANHRVQLFAADVGKDDGVLECLIEAS